MKDLYFQHPHNSVEYDRSAAYWVRNDQEYYLPQRRIKMIYKRFENDF